jgi:phospholipid/cholesterol/gamma-HCH transport system substrate-binding protein
METDRRYFLEGLFIIGFGVAVALFFVWLAGTGHRDDVLYRIHFAESVSGLSKGDSVKFSGVDIGTVDAMAIDPVDPRRVQVDVRLRKDAPVKTDTKAVLKLKGITGVVYIELEGGNANAKTLLATTTEGRIPEIPSAKSSLTTVIDELPKVVERFAAIENQTRKILSDVGETTGKIKEDPSVLLKGPKKEKSFLGSR